MIDIHYYILLLRLLSAPLLMDLLTDDVFPLFTTDNFAVFPSGFAFSLPSLISRIISAQEYEEQPANIFENTGCFKRNREEKSKRDFNERRTRNRGYSINEMKELNEKEFKKYFALIDAGFIIY